MGRTKVNHFLTTAAGLIASAVLLTICQTPFNQAWAAWIAWVPFMLICRPEIRLRMLLPLAWAVWLIYWLGNLYWLEPVTGPGYITFCISQALYAPLLVFCIRFVRRKQWPLTLLAPLIVVGAEAWQSVLYTGFEWYYLAHSQYLNLPLIQISDIFGQLGVSVLIAMVNGLLADLLLSAARRKFLRWPNAALTALVGLLLIATWIYGSLKLASASAYRTDGPVVGVAQTNAPSFVKELSDNGQALLDELSGLSHACFNAGAVLVAWPETMVLAGLNPDFLSYMDDNSNAVQYDRQIKKLAKNRGYVLVGAHRKKVGLVDGNLDIVSQSNTAFLYTPLGQQSRQYYDKIHLVPFGEYIPFKKSAPWIYRLILSPYDFDYNLTPGDKYTRFEIETDERPYQFGSMICYEDTDPAICRKLVLNKEHPQKADFLVNISNDGWYVGYKDGTIYPSVELPQRAAITVFRCVENHIAVIRSVNTGVSCLIDPDGRIINDYTAGNLPKNVMDRKGQKGEGWFVDQIPVDARITFFTRHGRWLDGLLGAGLASVFLIALIDSWKRKKKRITT